MTFPLVSSVWEHLNGDVISVSRFVSVCLYVEAGARELLAYISLHCKTRANRQPRDEALPVTSQMCLTEWQEQRIKKKKKERETKTEDIKILPGHTTEGWRAANERRDGTSLVAKGMEKKQEQDNILWADGMRMRIQMRENQEICLTMLGIFYPEPLSNKIAQMTWMQVSEDGSICTWC